MPFPSTRIHFLSQNRPGPRMGMGHYERLLFAHFLPLAQQKHPQWSFGITFDGRAPEAKLDPLRIAPQLETANFLEFSTERLKLLPWQLARTAVGAKLKKQRAALYHSLALGFPAPSLTNKGTPSIYYIHDLPPARFDDEGTLPAWRKQAAQVARAIGVPSEFAKRELIELLELPAEKIYVVPYGCENDRFHPGIARAGQEVLAALGVRAPFLLYAGGSSRRKNVSALLQAWQSVAREYSDLSLVMAGPPEPLRALVSQSNAPRVIIAGYLERETLGTLMKSSLALVFPSIYEGFGMPPLEALAMGVPVVAVRAGAVPEVCGEAALLAENGEPDALETALLRMLDDEALRAEYSRRGPLQAQNFSWERHAAQMLALYENVLGET